MSTSVPDEKRRVADAVEALCCLSRPSVISLMHRRLHGPNCPHAKCIETYGARPFLHTVGGFAHVDFLLPNGTLDCSMCPPRDYTGAPALAYKVKEER